MVSWASCWYGREADFSDLARTVLRHAFSASFRASETLGARYPHAQLGERLNGIQEVDGSIPFSSTSTSALVPGARTAFHLNPPPSSDSHSGLRQSLRPDCTVPYKRREAGRYMVESDSGPTPMPTRQPGASGENSITWFAQLAPQRVPGRRFSQGRSISRNRRDEKARTGRTVWIRLQRSKCF